MTAVTTSTRRLAWVDRLRGLAILVMVCDHVLAQVDPFSPFRFTVSRIGLPLFMLAAATVFRPKPSARRAVQIAAAAAAEAVLFSALDMRQPGIVAVYALLTFTGTFRYATRSPYLIGSLGLIQSLWLPLPFFNAYQPGEVLFWFCFGLLGSDELTRHAYRLPKALDTIGRHPLAWYCGHLIVLVGASLL